MQWPGEVYDCGCSGIPVGDCDCDGNQLDVLGICGGGCTADLDGDGICDDVDPCVGSEDAIGVCNGDCQSDANGNGICDVDDVPECTYAGAENYASSATLDDGSCVFGSNACAEDVNGDGLVGVSDILIVLSTFGQVCD